MARPPTADRAHRRLPRRLTPERAWRAAPALVAAAGAAIYLALEPHAVDLAAQTYRADLFGRAGLTAWDGNWYAGHHAPGYSILFPALGWLLGPPLAGALAAVAAAALFEALAYAHRGPGARAGALWFALASVTLLLSGRMAFALGVALGLAALLALVRKRTAIACALAAATALASPVAGLFLALAGTTLLVAPSARDRRALPVAVCALVPPAMLAVAFPEGGWEPFSTSTFWPLVAFALAAAAVLPRDLGVLRAGCVLYALAGAAAYALHTPVGGNALRLGQLFGGPLLVCALAGRRYERPGIAGPSLGRARALAAAALLAALAWWQWSPAVGDVARVASDRAAQPGFYRPLLAALAARTTTPARVEIPFTRSHWEAAEVGRRLPLARGWERQLDVGRNPLFYGRAPLTPATYRAWLDSLAVGFVAIARAPLDYSAVAEARLVERGLPYLRLVWRDRDWRLYEVVAPAPILGGAGFRAVSLGDDSLTFRASRAGAARVAVRFTPYWRLAGGCVERAAGGWTRVSVPRGGVWRLTIRFSLARVIERGRRCG